MNSPREKLATKEAIEALLRPRSIAVIGASTDPTKTSGLPVHFLRKHGYARRIYPVNPRVSEIDGLRCYPDIESLPEAPDAAMVLLGAERSVQAVASLASVGVKAAIVLASGFAETGEDGQRRQNALLEAAGPMRLLGPNTIGLVNVSERIPLSATGALAADSLAAGKVSVISQSGGILGSLLSRAAARGLGLSKLVSTSNEADLDAGDFLSFLGDDVDTEVITLYLETIRNPEKFRAAALKARANGKCVIALKIGRSDAGAKAAVSHTGAMAGSDQAYDSFLRQCGIIRAQTFGHLLDISTTLATQPLLRGKRIAIVTSTGGAGTLVSDSLGMAGLDTPPPDAATIVSIRAFLPSADISLDRNPIDVTLAGLQGDILAGTIRALSTSPSYDGLVVIVGSSGVARPELLANAVAAGMPEHNMPVLAYVSPHAPEATALLTKLGVPSFSEPESIAACLRALLDLQTPLPERAIAASAPVHIPHELSGALDESAAKSLFELFGISKTREYVVTTQEEAEDAARAIGGPVVLKILSREIIHKSDVGGVAIAVASDQIRECMARMTNDVEMASGTLVTRFLVQQMISGGIEMILGFNRDPLGDAIMLGMGGITAELFKDTSLRLIDSSGGLSRSEARSMIDDLKIAPLLHGFRGRPPADIDALVEAIMAFSRMVGQIGPRLREAEINPLFVLPVGQGVIAADGVAVLAART